MSGRVASAVAGAQDELQLEAHLGVIERVAEELLELGDPVAHGLLVHEQLLRNRRPLPLVAQPRQERLGEALTDGGPQPVEGREARAGEVIGGERLGVHDELGEVVLDPDRGGVAVGLVRPRPDAVRPRGRREVQRLTRLLPRPGWADDGAASAQGALQVRAGGPCGWRTGRR